MSTQTGAQREATRTCLSASLAFLVLALTCCGQYAVEADKLASFEPRDPRVGLLPGSVTLAAITDRCWDGGYGCTSDRLEQIVDIVIVDESIVERAPWDADWGSDLSAYRAYPLRALRPGTTALRVTGVFDDDSTRTAGMQVRVVEARSFTADVSLPTRCPGFEPQSGPTGGEGLVRRVFVDAEIPLLVTAWGVDEAGRDVNVGGHFGVPSFFDVVGVAHTVATDPESRWPNAFVHTVQVHERGEVTVVSLLPDVTSNDLVIRSIGESDIVGFTLGRGDGPVGFIPRGNGMFIEARPFDAQGEVCGRAPFIDRLVVVSDTPEVCVLRLDDGSLVEESGVRAQPLYPALAFEAYGVSEGTCVLRMKLPDMASWVEHAIEVYAVAPNDG